MIPSERDEIIVSALQAAGLVAVLAIFLGTMTLVQEYVNEFMAPPPVPHWTTRIVK